MMVKFLLSILDAELELQTFEREAKWRSVRAEKFDFFFLNDWMDCWFTVNEMFIGASCPQTAEDPQT